MNQKMNQKMNQNRTRTKLITGDAREQIHKFWMKQTVLDENFLEFLNKKYKEKVLQVHS